MRATDTTALSGRVLADSFADRIRRWSRDAGATESAARVAQRAAFVVSAATLDGNVCTDLSSAHDPALTAAHVRAQLAVHEEIVHVTAEIHQCA